MATYKELLKQQEALALQVEEARKREISDAVTQVRQMVSEFGLTERDVFESPDPDPAEERKTLWRMLGF